MSQLILMLLGCFGGAPYFPELGSNGRVWRDTGPEETTPPGDSSPDSPPEDSDPVQSETLVSAGGGGVTCYEGDPTQSVLIDFENRMGQNVALVRMLNDCTRSWVSNVAAGQSFSFEANPGAFWVVTTQDGGTDLFHLSIGSEDDEVSIP